MKRSEMVINLAIHLMSRLPEWTKESRREFADELLGLVEMDGMLPPIAKLDVLDGYDNCWEPEDSE